MCGATCRRDGESPLSPQQCSFWITDLAQISVESQQLACKILAPRGLLTVVGCPNSDISMVTDILAGPLRHVWASLPRLKLAVIANLACSYSDRRHVFI